MDQHRPEEFSFPTQAVLRGAETWLSAQSELLSGVEVMLDRWMQRQRETIDASAQSLTKICETQRVADVVEIQQQWVVDTMRRSISDMNTFADDTVALTRRVLRAANIADAEKSNLSERQDIEERPLRREAAE